MDFLLHEASKASLFTSLLTHDFIGLWFQADRSSSTYGLAVFAP